MTGAVDDKAPAWTPPAHPARAMPIPRPTLKMLVGIFIWRIAHRWISTFVVPSLLSILLRIDRPRWPRRRRAQAVGPPPVFRPKRKRVHLRSFRGDRSRMSFLSGWKATLRRGCGCVCSLGCLERCECAATSVSVRRWRMRESGRQRTYRAAHSLYPWRNPRNRRDDHAARIPDPEPR
jgi:hypothetical protein